MSSAGKQPVISVIMCVYNAAACVDEAIRSIIAQTYPDWELIICEDCSTDETRAVLQKWAHHPAIHIHYQPYNKGYLANKNDGFRMAKGMYHTQMDADDTCPPQRLERQLQVALAQPEIKIIGTGYNRMDISGRIFQTIQPQTDGFVSFRPDADYPFWFPGLLIHREVFDKIGYFHPYFTGLFGDDIYWTFLANQKYQIWCIREPLYNYRDTEGSITNKLNNERKLIITFVLDELFRQSEAHQTNWLEQGDLVSLEHFEGQLLDNHSFMAERYRIWAAKAIDKNDLEQAWKLLRTSFKLSPFNTSLYKTVFYYLNKSRKK